MNSVSKKLVRFAALSLAAFRSPAERLRVERRHRGWEQYKQLEKADRVVVSFGKSGRTWLRMMISRFYQVRYGLSSHSLIGFDNLHKKNPAIPTILFTHDTFLKDYTGNLDKSDYRSKRVVLLVRNPADTAVSQYHQWAHRMKDHKKVLNDFPAADEDVTLFDFVMGDRGGMPRNIEFLNSWAAALPSLSDVHVVRYEDLRANPQETLAALLEFMGTPGSDAEVEEAVEYSAFENMRKMESKRTFWPSGGRMVPKDRNNVNSYKVRRGEVGGYRGDFTPVEVEAVDAYLREHLSPVYGYGADGQPAVEEVSA